MSTTLSPGERQVLRLASEGLTIRWIAAVRGTKPDTVKTQIARGMDKLQAVSIPNAVAIAIRAGLI